MFEPSDEYPNGRCGRRWGEERRGHPRGHECIRSHGHKGRHRCACGVRKERTQ